MTGIRIEGTKEEIEATLERLRVVFTVNIPRNEKFHEKKDKLGNIFTDIFYYYCRVYIYEKDTTFDEMQAYKSDAEHLTERLVLAEAEMERLRQRLNELPTPSPGSMVLSPRHHGKQQQ